MTGGKASVVQAREPHPAEKEGGPLQEVVLDVSDLEPPEPLVRTLEAVETLQPSQYLRMLHRREPCLLFPHLDQRGFAYTIRKGKTTACEVLIWRAGDEQAATVVQDSNADFKPMLPG